MRIRTDREERRSGIRLIIIGIVLLVLAGLGVWLVYETNPSGEHDAWAIPIVGLVPLLLGIMRLVRLHFRHHQITSRGISHTGT